jgi:hypothetical protein
MSIRHLRTSKTLGKRLGVSDFDARHRFVYSYQYGFRGKGKPLGSGAGAP